jgi:hypothetical protein
VEKWQLLESTGCDRYIKKQQKIKLAPFTLSPAKIINK